MKITTIAILVLISSVAFLSCKKDNDDSPATIVGFWKGKYGSASTYPTFGYAFLFRSNGTVRVFNSADTATAGKAEGTYFVTDSIVTTKYIYAGTSTAYITKAAVDDKFSFIEGTWGNDPSYTDGGKFFINKQ